MTAKVYGGVHTLPIFGFESVTSYKETHVLDWCVHTADDACFTGNTSHGSYTIFRSAFRSQFSLLIVLHYFSDMLQLVSVASIGFILETPLAISAYIFCIGQKNL